MSTSYSGPKRHKILADAILTEFNLISEEFSAFQKSTKLNCYEGCGKCCFKPDIYCSPAELLPMALELIERGEAENFLDDADSINDGRCVFLNVTDEENFKGSCKVYSHRPLTCRTFGVSLRHGKNNSVDLSVCKPLKEGRIQEYQELANNNFSSFDHSLPFIDVCKNRLTRIDPSLMETEMPINEALKIILSKMLLYSEFRSDDSDA